MFRMNVSPDEETRKDLMTFIKGLLREAVPAAIAEKMSEGDWLESRFAAAIQKLNLQDWTFRWLQTASVWQGRVAQEAIDARVAIRHDAWCQKAENEIKARIDASFREVQRRTDTIFTQVNAKIDDITEDRIRVIIAEELRKRLG